MGNVGGEYYRFSFGDGTKHYQAIAPQSIILRVAMGRAWTENVASTLTWTIEVAGHTSTTLTQRSQQYDSPDDFRIKSEGASKGMV